MPQQTYVGPEKTQPREKEPFERPFSLSTHFTAPRAGPVAAADEQSAAEQRRTGQLMHVIEKLSR